MTITVEDDDGKTQVFQHVTDAYLCVRQLEPMQQHNGNRMAMLPETRSFSWGSNVRELVKEIRQSLDELQDFLRGIARGSSK